MSHTQFLKMQDSIHNCNMSATNHYYNYCRADQEDFYGTARFYPAEDNLFGECGWDAQDECGRTELMRAAGDGDKKRVMQLLDDGADIDLCDEDGKTALMYAAIHGRSKVAEILIDRGADTEACDNSGRTAMFFARRNNRGDIVKLIRESGADAEYLNGGTALLPAA